MGSADIRAFMGVLRGVAPSSASYSMAFEPETETSKLSDAIDIA